MFSSLRQDSTLYILDKTAVPVLNIGKIIGVSSPVPKYPSNLSLGIIETVVDITAATDDKKYIFEKVPSNLSIYIENGVIISENKEAMSVEVEAMRDRSIKTIESIDYHKSVVESCDNILLQLNPNIAREKEQENRLKSLEDKMGNIETVLSQMNQTLTNLKN